jgi:hypothetical protein
MLRLYCVDHEGKPMWRLSLENPLTQERTGFASLSDLFVFLQRRLGVAPDVVQEPVNQSDTQQSHAEHRIT